MPRKVNRLIDASINRILEGLRVCEDTCRFVIGDLILSGKLKEIRHRVGQLSKEFNGVKLLSNRDVEDDSLKFVNTDGENQRTSLESLIRSNIHRATEAIRSLEEYSKYLEKSSFIEFQQLRFQLYDMETEIVSRLLRGEKAKSLKGSIYAVIDTTLSSDGNYDDLMSFISSCNITMVQLVIKKENRHNGYYHGKSFVSACKKYNILSIISDYADVALMAGADGLHLDKKGLPIDRVRKILDVDMIIGTTVRTIEDVHLAEKHCADYLLIEPIDDIRNSAEPVIKGIGYANYEEIVKKSHLPTIAYCDIKSENCHRNFHESLHGAGFFLNDVNDRSVKEFCEEFRAAMEQGAHR